jgi:hypothetical protein
MKQVLFHAPSKEIATMASKPTKSGDALNLTREESESMGVAFQEELPLVPIDLREHLLHEQVGGSLDEDEVTEMLTGEVTPDTREQMEDLFADVQEEAADRQAD